MQWVLSATTALTGLLIGSFLNVVIHRGPAMWKLVDDESRRGDFVFPRSYCPACQAPIRMRNLTPVLSYLVLRGKCASCNAAIPFRYPAVELLACVAALGAYHLFGLTLAGLLAALFFWCLIALAAIDLETGFLPDALTLPLIALGVGANAARLFTSPPNALIGAAAGYLVFRIIGALFFRLRGIEGLGQGDAKLLAAIGAWLGWQALAPTVFAAALTALGGVLIARLLGEEITNRTPIPFGPALAAAGAAMMALGAASNGGGYLGAIVPTYP